MNSLETIGVALAVCALFAGTAQANIVTNGGFETGNTAGWASN